MATQFAFGKITTDGLVLALDAADRNSYVSGSTTWRDLSTSNNTISLALVSGSTYDLTNQGTFKFSGSSSFANISTTVDFANSSSFTLEGVISIPTFSQFANRAHWIGSTGGNSMVVFFQNQLFMWNQAGGANSLSIAATFNPNVLYYVTITRNTSNLVTLYINGSSVGSGTRDGQFTWATIARLGSGTTLCSVINISKMAIYNRDLSAAEVLQNYNAQKSRFGL